MFELGDKEIEQIIFAMEDQERAARINLETGELVSSAEASGEQFVDPPSWSSRDGFKLMEDFLASIRQPSARAELTAALGRGRGVFKAFKAVLAQHEDIERAFRDFKIKSMRRRIGDWYDNQREALGLQRLGPEPEETGELVMSDLEIDIRPYAEAKAVCDAFLSEFLAESRDFMPAVIAGFEGERLLRELALDDGAPLCAIAGDGEGGVLGLAIGFREHSKEGSFARIAFLGIHAEFRRMGLGSALLGSLSRGFAKEGLGIITLDCPYLPAEYGNTLEKLGFLTFGLRALARLD